MNDIEVSSIDLVEGGNVFKQGHYLTLGYVPRDEKGETVDLSGKTLNVSLWGRKGVVFEAAAIYSAGVIRFTFDKMVAAGDYTVEFTATSSTDAKYRKKFPTNQHSGRIAIKQSADDLGVIGISVYTIEKFEQKQKAIQDAYEQAVDSKVTEIDQRLNDGIGALTEDSEVIDARMGKANLRQFNEGLTAQLAETEKRIEGLSIKNYEREIPLTTSAASSFYSSYTADKATDGIKLAGTNVAAAWMVGTVNINPWIKLNMPIGVVIGDSISRGANSLYGRLDTGGGNYDLTKLNELGQFSYFLEEHLKLRVYNHGIGSQRADQIRARWHRDVLAQTDTALTPPTTLTKKPSFVQLVVGINDVFANRTAADIIADLEFMINSAVENDIYLLAFTIGSHGNMDAPKLAVTKEVNAWLRKKNSEVKTMSLFDFYEYTNDPANDGKPKEGVFTDGVHPSKRVYQLISQELVRKFFTESNPAIRPRFLNISTEIDSSYTSNSLSRPVVYLLAINDIYVSYYEFNNVANQFIELPPFAGIMDNIKLEIVYGEAPVETPSSSKSYYYISEAFLSDEKLFSDVSAPIRLPSEIRKYQSVAGIFRFAVASPDPANPGVIKFPTTASSLNTLGIHVIATTTNETYVCEKGLTQAAVVGATYPGDSLVTTSNSRLARTDTPTAGAVVAKVVRGTTGDGTALINVL